MMNAIRQIFGIVWILLGLAAGYFLVFEQSLKLFEKGGMDSIVPAIIKKSKLCQN